MSLHISKARLRHQRRYSKPNFPWLFLRAQLVVNMGFNSSCNSFPWIFLGTKQYLTCYLPPTKKWVFPFYGFKIQCHGGNNRVLFLIMGCRELYRNDIGGKIPEELGNLKSLVSMDLYGNRFEGEIPKSFAKLKSLKFL